MKDLDSIFTKYHNLNPPSECVKTKQRILNSLLILQEAATAVYDSNPQELSNETQKFDTNKIKDSQVFLNNFRRVFGPLTTEIDEYLKV